MSSERVSSSSFIDNSNLSEGTNELYVKKNEFNDVNLNRITKLPILVK